MTRDERAWVKQLERENLELKQANRHWLDDIEQEIAERKLQLARAEAAESTQARLREYAAHKATCGKWIWQYGGLADLDATQPCTCGLAAILTPAADQDEKRNA